MHRNLSGQFYYFPAQESSVDYAESEQIKQSSYRQFDFLLNTGIQYYKEQKALQYWDSCIQ